jgi:predicted RND superfamily exporter protein
VHHLTRLSPRHPKILVELLLAVTALLAAGLPRLRTEFGFRILIGDDHPSIWRLDRMIEQFGDGFPALIAWECGVGHPCRHALDEASLKMADEVSRQLEATRGIRTVHGPSNAPLLVPAADGFDIRTLVEHGQVAADAESLALQAVADLLWVGELSSADGLVGVIVVQPTDTRSETDLWG